MKYVMLILNTDAVAQLSAEEQQAWYSEIFAWYEKYGASGALADGGQQLQGPETARTIRSGGVTDGPAVADIDHGYGDQTGARGAHYLRCLR